MQAQVLWLENLRKQILSSPQRVIERPIGLHFQLIHNTNQREINGHELFIVHRKRGFARANHDAQITRTRVDSRFLFNG
jgi:hypothetical protein